jgi:hypothetical protein
MTSRKAYFASMSAVAGNPVAIGFAYVRPIDAAIPKYAVLLLRDAAQRTTS